MDEHGVPLSIVVCGANRHDVTQLESLLDAMVVPELRPMAVQNLCVDKGYRGAPANAVMCDRGYAPHVPVADDERTVILNDPDHYPRRWIVEVAHSWFKRFRKLLVRFEKSTASYMAPLHLAASIICWRKLVVIYGYALNVEAAKGRTQYLQCAEGDA